MAKRGPKKRQAPTGRSGVEPLESRNIVVGTHRTSMRLEPSMWEALEDITTRETLSINELCTMIKERLDAQARLRGDVAGEVTLTSAVRVFIAAYFRRASTEDGHARAGHGMNDPFCGTPFEGRVPGDFSATQKDSATSQDDPSPAAEQQSSPAHRSANQPELVN